MNPHPKQTLLGALLLLALVGMHPQPSAVIAAEGPVQAILESAIYKTTGPEVDLFLNPSGYFSVYGVELLRIEDEDSGEAIIRAEIALFNGGADEATIPKGVRILTFSHKAGGQASTPNKKVVDVVTDNLLKIPGRSDGWPGFTILTVDFDNEFLDSGLNELVYTVDPDNGIAESTYLVFEGYQALLATYGGDIRKELGNKGEDLSSLEQAKYEDSIWDVSCTVISKVYVSEGKSIIPVEKRKLQCENGLTGNVSQLLAIGMTIILRSGFTVDAAGNIVSAPDLSADVKVWDPGWYILGEANNQGDYGPLGQDKVRSTLKVYSPDSYPDLVVTSVRAEPDTIVLFDEMSQEYTVVIEGVNAGADMTQRFNIQMCIEGTEFNHIKYLTKQIKAGEQFEIRWVMSLIGLEAGLGDKIGHQIRLRARGFGEEKNPSHVTKYFWAEAGSDPYWSDWSPGISHKSLYSPPGLSPTRWDFFLNAPENAGRPQYASPLEVGSEAEIILSLDGSCFDLDWDPSPGNWGEVTVSIKTPTPLAVYPETGHAWEQGIYPPLLDRNYFNKAGTKMGHTVALDCPTLESPAAGWESFYTVDRTVHSINYERSLEMWSYDCVGMGQDFFDAPLWGPGGVWFIFTMLVDKEFKATEKWIDEWRNSVVRFQWIPSGGVGEPPFRVQIHDDAQVLIYETFVLPIPMIDVMGHPTGTMLSESGEYDEDYTEYYSNLSLPEEMAENLIQSSIDNGLVNQWVYDGPPLGAGEYTFRVAYPGNASLWSEELTFFIESEGTTPGDSITLRDTDLTQEIRFVGTITAVGPEGITVATDEGTSVHVNIDDDTVISSEATGLEGHIIPGLKVEVTVPVVPYVNERAYVPLNQIPTASSITDFITPELIYPKNGQVFELGEYPPIQEDWALCASQECDQANLLASPSLDTWKVGWIDSLVRFRWLPTLTTENARFKLEIQNDSGTVVYESDFVPGLSEEGSNGTSTGIAIDETTWLGDDPIFARHYSQILGHYWIDRRAVGSKGGDQAIEGKFYQYVYDGSVLMPGEYTWKIARIPEAVGEPAVWSSESTFVVKAAPSEPGSPDQLEQSSGKEKVVFKGKVTKITPGGFIVATDSGLVHVRTDAETRIFSTLTQQLLDEVPLDWKVIVLGEVEPYILDRPYTAEDGNIFSGQIADIRPGGFSVVTQSGLVHMQSDASTVIHSAETGLHNETPVGWNVHFISQVAPYLSGRAYVPNVQIPIATNVIEQMPTAADVTELVVNRAHKRCTALGPTDEGTTAFSCDDGDYVELNTTDIPNGSSAVILVQHNPVTVDCTVVSNPSSTNSILQCEDGHNKIIPMYLEVGTVVQSPNDAAKLVSTAGTLYNRMERFKSQAGALNDSALVAELSNYQDEANTGFKEAYQQAMANAAPEVLAVMELMGTLSNKIAGLAQSFISGGGQLIFDDHDIQELAGQLRQFADNYGSIVDIMVIETLADLPQQTQDKAKTNIKNVNSQFLSNMKSNLEQTAQLLEQGNIPDAITLLDKITSEEEVWMQQMVQPYFSIILAQQALDAAVEQLSLYGDIFSKEARSSLHSKIDTLNNSLSLELQQRGTVELMPLIKDLWEAIGSAWEIQLEAMSEELLDGAESAIADHAEFMGEGVEDEIRSKIKDLNQAISGDDESLIRDAVDALAETLALWSGESGGEGSSQSSKLVAAAIKIECGSETTVGKVLDCSYNYTKLPDQVTWSAIGGTPSSGSGDSFQTSFPMSGEFSVSIEACIGSACVTDVQAVTVVPEPPSEESPEGQSSEAHAEESPEDQSSETHSSSS